MKILIIWFITWAGLASNQAVTFTDAQDAVNNGIFDLRAAITSSTTCMTKSDASAKLFLNEVYTPFANKTSGQLVVKSDLVPAGRTWYTSAVTGCPVNTSIGTLYENAARTIAYTDAQLTTTYNGGGNYYTPNNGVSYTISSVGVITLNQAC